MKEEAGRGAPEPASSFLGCQAPSGHPLQLPESYQALLFLIPKGPANQIEGVCDPNSGGVLEFRNPVHGLLEAIVWNSGVQVVDMVNPDVRSDPLERFGEYQK